APPTEGLATRATPARCSLYCLLSLLYSLAQRPNSYSPLSFRNAIAPRAFSKDSLVFPASGARLMLAVRPSLGLPAPSTNP
ncbi:MAG TPA: hypothetical protein VNC50_01600, partial [Planctomycetia bacterium]|nr:hypothetical protein [Planctomycetia bacterium]